MNERGFYMKSLICRCCVLFVFIVTGAMAQNINISVLENVVDEIHREIDQTFSSEKILRDYIQEKSFYANEQLFSAFKEDLNNKLSEIRGQLKVGVEVIVLSDSKKSLRAIEDIYHLNEIYDSNEILESELIPFKIKANYVENLDSQVVDKILSRLKVSEESVVKSGRIKFLECNLLDITICKLLKKNQMKHLIPKCRAELWPVKSESDDEHFSAYVDGRYVLLEEKIRTRFRVEMVYMLHHMPDTVSEKILSRQDDALKGVNELFDAAYELLVKVTAKEMLDKVETER